MNTLSETYYSDIKEEIRSRVDIASVVGRYVKLKSSGQNLKGLCPFHKEKTPSFTVNPAKSVFHCFGCGKGGDIFTFLMEIEGLTFPEALQRLADETGVNISPIKESGITSVKGHITKTDALRIHEIATQYYYDQMKKNPRAIEYFKSRNLTSETVMDFRLGYAPEGWSNFIDYAASKNIKSEKLVDCGLAVSSSQDSAPYDRFRNRIIFPVFDISGHPIAFGGRCVDNEDKPKYLNSPETILYRKNRVLYGLHKSRTSIKEKGFAVFVEGYMDFLSLYQSGIHNVVATSGTALTEEQGRIIRRFTTKVVLVFDGDSAGVTAAERAIFLLAPNNLDIRVFILPKEKDPDSYIQEYSAENFIENIEKSVDAVNFILNRIKEKYDTRTATGKSAAVQHIIPFIKSTTDAITRAEFVKQIAEQLDVREQLIYSKLRNKKQVKDQEFQIQPDNNAERFLETEEGSFLHILVNKPELIKYAEKHIPVETFTDQFSKKLYLLILENYRENLSLQGIIDLTDDAETKAILSLMLIKDIATDNLQGELCHKGIRLLRKSLFNQRHIITKKLRDEHDSQIRTKLLYEQKYLIARLSKLDNEW